MTFSSDRDLLTFEPDIFTQMPLAGQALLSATTGSVANSIVTCPGCDFTNLKIDTGSVVLINDLPHEVISQIDIEKINISMIRGSNLGQPIKIPDQADITLKISTFRQQRELTHQLLLQRVGIDIDDTNDAINADQIISITAMNVLEILGTLERIFRAGVSVDGENTQLIAKADYYHELFEKSLNQATIQFDISGDGLADHSVDMGTCRFIRN